MAIPLPPVLGLMTCLLLFVNFFVYNVYRVLSTPKTESVNMSPLTSTPLFRNGVATTLAWCFMLYTFYFLQSVLAFVSFSRRRAKKGGDDSQNKLSLFQAKYTDRDPEVLAADRTVTNTVEQSLIFIPIFWLSIVVELMPPMGNKAHVQEPGLVEQFLPFPLEALRTDALGIAWIAFRSLFFFTFHVLPKVVPRVWGLPLHLFLCTIPAYTCIWIMATKIAVGVLL
ncbi:unnamed protein product [Amoebophrya sp. A25]|nr:unnamed protein product [Amoebophrya sp. A25]|eukprot:GSA25T00006382001.1